MTIKHLPENIKYRLQSFSGFHSHVDGLGQTLLLVISFGLIIPFITQAIPIRIPITLFTIIPLTLYFLIFIKLKDSILNYKVDALTFILVSHIVIYMLALNQSNTNAFTESFPALIYGSFYTTIIALLPALHSKQNPPLVILNNISPLFEITAIVAAFLGLLKFVLSKQGIFLNFVLNASSGDYPYGTTLLSDYNFYGLTLLIGSLFLFRRTIYSLYFNNTVLFAFLFTVVSTTGFFTGSRRFILCFPAFILLSFCIHFIFNKSLSDKPKKLLGIFFGAFIGVFTILLLIILIQGDANTSKLVYDGHLIAQLKTFKQPDLGGTPRFERWRYACQLISEINLWQLHSFNYRELFGCHFLECSFQDYPHLPLLSATLYGGLFGFSLTIVFYILVFQLIWDLYKLGKCYLELTLILIAVTAYTAISGDTIFSVPPLMVSIILGKMGILLSKTSSSNGHTA